MAVEIKTFPSKLIIAFDSLSALAEQEHEKGYVRAFCAVLNCIGCFVKRDVHVEIPDFDGGSDIIPNMLFEDVITNALVLGRKFYYLDTYEVKLVFNIDDIKYQLQCYSDPVVFTFEKM